MNRKERQEARADRYRGLAEKANKQWKKRYPNVFSSEKVDYKEGDVYENQLWCILGRFPDSFQAGHELPFTDLVKAGK